MNYAVVLFFTANHSIWAARLLKKAGIERRLVPIPRYLSSECGYCIRILKLDSARVVDILNTNDIGFDRLEDYK